MQEISTFIVDNWQWLLTLAAGVFEFILLIILKRRPCIIDNSQYKDLLVFVNEAEEKFGAGHGTEKLDYVIDRFLNFKGLDKNYWNKANVVSLVEYILRSPQKKVK